MVHDMSVLKEKSTVKRRTKGEQTRNQILNAAIEVLARQGIKGTTHRAIAQHAQLQLSLTTYYFKDIQELVHEAFMLSSTRTISKSGAAWIEAFESLKPFNKTQLKKLSLRTEISHQLGQMASQYLIQKIKESPIELAVEQLLFTEIQTTPRLRVLAQNHREALLQPFIQLCNFFNEETALMDADVLLTMFTQLEYRNLVVPKEEIDEHYIHTAVQRVLNWVLQVKQNS